MSDVVDGFLLGGEVRKFTSERGYDSVWILPASATEAIRVSTSTEAGTLSALKDAPLGTRVVVALSAPRLATSKAGKPYLGGLQVLDIHIAVVEGD